MGFLTTLGKGARLILQKNPKKMTWTGQYKYRKQSPANSGDNRLFLAAYRPKRCAGAADRVQGEGEEGEGIEVIGQKHGLEDADLGLFYAGVRHFYAPAKCFFGVVKTGKGRRKFCLRF